MMYAPIRIFVLGFVEQNMNFGKTGYASLRTRGMGQDADVTALRTELWINCIFRVSDSPPLRRPWKS